MIRRKEGFQGERMVVLPPRVIETEEQDPLTSSLYITDIGHYPMAEHHYRERREAIDQYVLIYCVDGSGWYRLGSKEYTVGRDQYFILPAGMPHAYGACEGECWTIYWVHFKGAHAAIYAEGAQTPHNIEVTLNSRIADRISVFDESLSTLSAGDALPNLRYASSLLHYFLASMSFLKLYRNATSTADGEHDIVDAAIHFMQENVERRITLNDMLTYVGYSASHFSSLFRKHTGCSPLSYFNRLKMEYAGRLLRNTDLPVNKICFKVGFDDSFYFSRLFSKTMGMSPTKYREATGKALSHN
jgi:AraC-like DNA-binding protein